MSFKYSQYGDDEGSNDESSVSEKPHSFVKQQVDRETMQYMEEKEKAKHLEKKSKKYKNLKEFVRNNQEALENYGEVVKKNESMLAHLSKMHDKKKVYRGAVRDLVQSNEYQQYPQQQQMRLPRRFN